MKSVLSILRLCRQVIANPRHKYCCVQHLRVMWFWVEIILSPKETDCSGQCEEGGLSTKQLERGQWDGWAAGEKCWVGIHTQCKLHAVNIAQSEHCKQSFHRIETECTRRNPRDQCFTKNVPLVASLRLIPAFELRHICCGLTLQSNFKAGGKTEYMTFFSVITIQQ